MCWTQIWITCGVLLLSRLHESDSCSAFVLPRFWIHAYLLLSRWKWIPDSDLNFLKKWIYFKVDSEFSVKFSLKIIKDTLNLFWLDKKMVFFFWNLILNLPLVLTTRLPSRLLSFKIHSIFLLVDDVQNLNSFQKRFPSFSYWVLETIKIYATFVNRPV